MAVWSFRYAFRQAFRAPAPIVYAWCTDYDAGDVRLMGEDGERTVEHLTDDLIELSDRTRRNGTWVRTQKVVRLNPEAYSWTSTYFVGPRKGSQFLYRVVPRGPRRSRLEFTGLQVEHNPGTLSADRKAAIARSVARVDAGTWRRLARALDLDVAAGR
ncbi:MAG: hypothetical protein WCA77_05770 [Thermoplasmata archaeon]